MIPVLDEALLFPCQGESLVGVLSRPERVTGPGMLIVTGGPQYRVGSHRLFVTLARGLAAQGIPVLRFDCRGMGDSSGRPPGFDDSEPDIAAALGAFARAMPGVEQFVVWGMCDGASAALLYLHGSADPRVAALALVNPWVRTPEGQARTQVKHYYLQRLREREFWIKLASGRVAFNALSGLFGNLRKGFGPRRGRNPSPQSFSRRMAEAWSRFEGSVMLILSEHDYVAREFEDHVAASPFWQAALSRLQPKRLTLASADHTCSQSVAKASMQEALVDWLRDMR